MALQNQQDSLEAVENEDYIEIWEDLVSIKTLVVAIILCSTTAMTGYFIAPDTQPMPLFFGLAGALIGFILLSIFIKPKRQLIDSDEEA